MVMCSAELLASALTGQPLHPVLGDTTAGGNFSKYNKEKAPISPFHCVDGNFSELRKSPLSRPETIRILEAMWLLVESVLHSDGLTILGEKSARNYYRARTAILESPEIALLKETKDYIYQCCRLTATLLLNAAESHLPLGSGVKNRPIVRQLEHNLKFAELPTSWGVFRGVYFNVILVGTAASLGMSTNGYFRNLVGSSMGYYACGVWAGAEQPVVMLKRFQDLYRGKKAPLFSLNPPRSQPSS
jgi:hypothetical protein